MRGENDAGRKRMIRTDADVLEALEALSEQDHRLAPVLRTAGTVPLRRSRSGLEGLIAIVVAQQVSKASADAIFSRLSSSVDLTRAEAILAADEAVFRTAGLSRPKHETVRAIAEAIAAGKVDLPRCEAATAEAAIAELVAVRGIGPWTAECYLLFCAGHRDVFPCGDLALQAAVGHALGHETRPTARQLGDIALAWQPHRSVAARLFWAYYSAIHRREIVPAAEAKTPGAKQVSRQKTEPAPPGQRRRSAKPLS
ncbi:DNA-3-methyladenine glycosylase family protein [Jiella mangrovi]|uniref:DNA-3-methyladenine glycosylase II n=1 Tax=Jiella mangrovi TaxID=2821407 RepID=A0ABS4BDX0_9HYPH|nr:DNA-3-methyladenine glycosylase 2 family protein [Jiella mangrovi]MBP0614957.1 DNA-3-methyladenine glycosylase 2 family protein [Jiella mangrovi]